MEIYTERERETTSVTTPPPTAPSPSTTTPPPPRGNRLQEAYTISGGVDVKVPLLARQRKSPEIHPNLLQGFNNSHDVSIPTPTIHHGCLGSDGVVEPLFNRIL
ncbi:hypothetical protein M8C21_007447 [Ambrosia artemisiifolia]|uniref:Uncharacterized protein n=1 Tax=Ambrosia artemisiifolia TaxID=4212 RepID=A0AAD5D550_AMBAR|nr:hypothetical protein M8C21_007447 [Ambrosia artemisiifolia]